MIKFSAPIYLNASAIGFRAFLKSRVKNPVVAFNIVALVPPTKKCYKYFIPG
jgi:hypothetical protein